MIRQRSLEENLYKEDKEIFLGDGAVKIFLNTDSKMDDVSKESGAFLDYVAGRETEDSYVKKLQNAVDRAKKNREWRHEYMTLLMRDQENIEKGIEKGTLQERRKIIIQMIGQGFNDGQIMSVCETNEEEISLCRKNMRHMI